MGRLETLAAHEEDLNLKIALENLGDGRKNLLNTGRLAGSLIQRIGSPHVRMNYDSRNPGPGKSPCGSCGRRMPPRAVPRHRFRCTESVEFQAVFWLSSAILASHEIRGTCLCG